jgi:hypothetical protein
MSEGKFEASNRIFALLNGGLHGGQAPEAWRKKYEQLYPKSHFPTPATLGQLTARLIAVDEELRASTQSVFTMGRDHDAGASA